MKKWYRIITVVLAVALLSGCKIVQSDPIITPPTKTESLGTTETVSLSTTGPTDPEPAVSVQYLPKEVDNPDGLPVLKWVCLTEWLFLGWGNRVLNETAMVEINQMLADREMPFRLQLITLTMKDWYEETDWFSRASAQKILADADLIYGMMKPEDTTKYLSPITDYVNGSAAPSLENAVSHELAWTRATIDGAIYGIPAYPAEARSNGWLIDPVVFGEYGFSEEDFLRPYWEMDDIFAKIYKENGNKAFMPVNKGITWMPSYTNINNTTFPTVIFDSIYLTYQYIGSCFAIDHSKEKATVINYLAEDTVQNIWLAAERYMDAGYCSSLIEDEDIKIRYSGVKGNTTYVSWDSDICIPMTDSVIEYTYPEGYMNGIAAVSQHKEEATQLLNLIAEDEAFRVQLLFGKEGRDYQINDDYYTIIKQEDGTAYSMNILSPLSFFCGLTSQRGSYSEAWSDGTANGEYVVYDGKSVLESNQENLNDHDHIFYPLVFDYSGFKQELTALEMIYKKHFSTGTDSMTEERYTQMLQELKDAGSEKIQAELQRQLDEWLAENPDWLAQYG